jgi:replicative DNA helicase
LKSKIQKQDEMQKLPSSPDAEIIVLGALLVGADHSAEIFEMLRAEDFDDPRHRVIFSAMKEIWMRNLPCELPMLRADLSAAGKIEDAGGIGYICTIGDGVHQKIQTDGYVSKVREMAIRRELVKVSGAIQMAAFDAEAGGNTAAELIDMFLERLAAIGQLASNEAKGTSQRDAAVTLLCSLSDKKTVRVFTDIRELDEIVGGARAGEVHVITAETGVGKTFFALQIAKRACKDGHHVLYCSGEMLAPHLMGRVLSTDSRVDYWKIRRPEKLSEIEHHALFESSTRQCEKCLILDGELTLSRIRMAARAMAAAGHLGCVIVDYDELVEVQGKDEWEQQRILVRSLKSLGMELQVPIFEVSQLRKALDDKDRKRPTLQRLYGSGAKGKHASVVLYVDRRFVQDLKGDETEAQVFILKSRDGRMGVVDCSFNIRSFRFEQEVHEKAESLPYKD